MLLLCCISADLPIIGSMCGCLSSRAREKQQHLQSSVPSACELWQHSELWIIYFWGAVRHGKGSSALQRHAASWSQMGFWKLMAGVQVEDICSFCPLCLNSLLRSTFSLLCSRQSS